jgi:hypothetical protein
MCVEGEKLGAVSLPLFGRVQKYSAQRAIDKSQLTHSAMLSLRLAQEAEIQSRNDDKLVQDCDQSALGMALFSDFCRSVLRTLHFRLSHGKRQCLVADLACQRIHAWHARALPFIGASPGMGRLSCRICYCGSSYRIRPNNECGTGCIQFRCCGGRPCRALQGRSG